MKLKRLLVIFLALTTLIIQSCENFPITSSSINSNSLSTSSGFIFDNEEFNDYLDNLFVEMLRGSPLDINFLLRYPEKYGLENEEVTPIVQSRTGYEQYIEFVSEVIGDIESFEDEDLSPQQVLDKHVILDALANQLCMGGFYYYDRPLSSTLGYQAQLPFILAEYRFDDVKDIYNYFKIIEYLPQSFTSLIDYEKEKIEIGLGLNNDLINRIIIQIDNLLDQEENFLIPIFNEKIGYVTDLDKSRDSYVNEHKNLINNSFVGAYELLKDELEKLKGDARVVGGLSNYVNGQAYFLTLFRSDVGVHFSSIDEIKDEIDTKISKTIQDFTYLVTFNPKVINEMSTHDFSLGKKKDEIIEYLIQATESSFPSLVASNLRYEFKNIHPSLQETSSPAMYLISPIDDNAKEVIYINPTTVESDSNYLYNVIAHEGVPGHMYQHVYFKNSKSHPIRHLFSFSGYDEGWAKYVEDYVLTYTSSSHVLTKAIQYNNLVYYLALVRCDIGVNYDSWTKQEMSDYLDDYFSINQEGISELYEHLVENPVNTSMYYYSYYQFYKLRDYMRSELGDSNYSDYDFHRLVLDTGPSSFRILKAEIDKYINKAK